MRGKVFVSSRSSLEGLRQKKVFIILVLFLVISLFIVLSLIRREKYWPDSYTLSQIEEKMKSFHPYAINECVLIARNLNLKEAICTIVNRRVVLRNEYLNCSFEEESCVIGTLNTTFSPSDYFSHVVNLEKLEIPFEKYYVCVLSNIPIYETSYPKRNDTVGIKLSTFECFGKFNRGEFHAAALSAFVLNKPGRYKIMEIYVFDGNLPENFEFKKNLGKGLKVYEFWGEIKV